MFRRADMRQHVLLLQQPVTNFQCSIYNGVGSWIATCIHTVYTHHINCNPHQARCWSRRRGHRRHVHLNPQESRENRPTVREAVAHCVMHCCSNLQHFVSGLPESFGHDVKQKKSCRRAQPVCPASCHWLAGLSDHLASPREAPSQFLTNFQPEGVQKFTGSLSSIPRGSDERSGEEHASGSLHAGIPRHPPPTARVACMCHAPGPRLAAVARWS